jgi:hypothetical protein
MLHNDPASLEDCSSMHGEHAHLQQTWWLPGYAMANVGSPANLLTSSSATNLLCGSFRSLFDSQFFFGSPQADPNLGSVWKRVDFRNPEARIC